MLRNREFIVFLVLVLAIAAFAAAVGFALSLVSGIAVCGCAVLLITAFLLFTRWRYSQLTLLSSYLRKINQGDYALDVRDNTEGELSILKNEIFKTTVMLRERSELLERDKAVLENALSDISHQLKTPLTSLFVMTDLLCDSRLPAQKRREFTARIRVQLERIKWLVSALLKLSRLDAKAVDFKSAQVTARELIDTACAPLLIPAELKEQQITIEDNGCALCCDAGWTAEALLNILKNCVEHTPAGGQIRISCTQNPLYTQITVEDSGTGIPAEDLPYIFGRFYRGKNASNDSVGIGLAMAHTIISEQGGTLEAQSASGGGSVFTIRMPK